MLAPNAMLTHQVDHIQFWRVYPVDGANRCRIELNVFWPKPMDEEAERKARLNVDLVWDVTTQEDFPQSVAIHRNLASGAVPDLVFGRNEPALIYYHQNIANAIGSDRLIPITELATINSNLERCGVRPLRWDRAEFVAEGGQFGKP